MNIKSIIFGYLAGPFLATITIALNGFFAAFLIQIIFEHLANSMNWITAYFTVSQFLIDAGFALLGGYVAGRIAKQDKYLHAGMVVLIGGLINFGLLFLSGHFYTSIPKIQATQVMLYLAIYLPYAMVGAHLASSKTKNLPSISSETGF